MVIVTLLPNYAFADKNIDIDIVESSAEVNFVEFESFSEFVEDYALVSGKTIAEAESELMSKGITSRSSIQYGYFTKRLTVYPTTYPAAATISCRWSGAERSSGTWSTATARCGYWRTSRPR